MRNFGLAYLDSPMDSSRPTLRYLCIVLSQVLFGPMVGALLVLFTLGLLGGGAAFGQLPRYLMSALYLGASATLSCVPVTLPIGLVLALLERLGVKERMAVALHTTPALVLDGFALLLGALLWPFQAASLSTMSKALSSGAGAAIPYVVAGGLAAAICSRLATLAYGVLKELRADPFEEIDRREGYVAEKEDLEKPKTGGGGPGAWP